MTDSVPGLLPAYMPDENLARRKAIEDAKPKNPLTTDKPIRFRVTHSKATTRHHYPRKARRRREQPDLRNPTYY